jgi:hypothetical protein
MLSPKEFQDLYISMYEARDDDAKEMRRLAAQERRAGNSDRMDSKVAAKYADSESKSAKKADEKSKGKHIHGMADSVEVDGEVIESAVPGQPAERLGAVTGIPQKERDAARERTLTKAKEMREKNKKKIREDLTLEAKNKEGKEQGADGKACWKNYKYAGTENGKDKCVKAGYEMEGGQELDERSLDSAETQEKERLVKGMKKSAKGFKKRYGARATSVMYATATKQAKRNMDTSQSDRRYSVEEANPEHRTRKPSQIAKQQKLTKLLDQIRSKKGENNN